MTRAPLILFDIDGTLLKESGATHAAAFADALQHVTGAPNPFRTLNSRIAVNGTPITGLVDAQIAKLCLATAVSTSEAEKLAPAFRTALISAYLRRIERGEPWGQLLPGVEELLDELRRRDLNVGLLTGNTSEIAASKMRSAGLAGRFLIGGFGGVICERSLLFSQALNQAARSGLKFSGLCYTGDTPLDIAAGAATNVPVVAVATGSYRRNELSGAADVLGDFTDTDNSADRLQAAARTKLPKLNI